MVVLRRGFWCGGESKVQMVRRTGATAELEAERLGLGLDGRTPVATLVAEAKRARRAGFRRAWAVQYHYYRDPFVVLSAIGAATRGLGLGTAVTNVYERHPITLAMCAATLGELTRSRLILGLGRGVRYTLERQMGIPYRRPQDVLREAVALIKAYLSGETVNVRGDVFRVRDVTSGQSDVSAHLRPAVYLAAVGPKALRLAAEIADGVILNYCTPPAYTAHAVDAVRRARRGSSGPTGFGVASLIWTMPRATEESMAYAKRALADLLSFPGFGESLLPFTGEKPDFLGALRRHYSIPDARTDIVAAAELVTESMVRSAVIVGERRARSRLREYVAAGLDYPILTPLGEDQLHETIDVFGSG